METLITILVIGLILGLALGYIFKAKKAGNKCIGCSACKSQNDGSCSSCHSTQNIYIKH